MAFTTPSTALFLPIAAGLWVLAELIGARPRWQPAMLGWCVAALAALAGGMLPARLYLGDLRQAGMLLAFEPRASGVTQLTALPYPVPMAQPEGLFLGLGGLAQQAWDASHVVYLGLPMLVLGVLLGLRRGPGRAAGWALLLGGIIVALGPMLVSGDAFVLWDDRRLRLPAALLEALHYPTRTSGMYYRAVVLAALGLPLLVASGWPRRRAWWWAALAWLLALLHVGDGWRITRELWPPPSGPVPGEALLVAMAEDPQPGAVLDLPIEGGTWEGGNAMIAATIHGRATTAMPRQTSVRYLPQTARLATLFERALAAEEPLLAQALLADRGFRYLCWRPWLGEHGRLAALEGALGPALGDEQLYCWPLEPDPRL